MAASALTALCCFLLSFAVVTFADECKPLTNREAATQKLRKYLFCNYDRELTPIKNQSTSIQVDVQLALDDLRFDEGWYTLDLHCYVTWVWFDEFLQWKEADYDGIDQLLVDEQSIWVPNILLYAPSLWHAEASMKPSNLCDLRPTGEVYCFIPTLFMTHCIPDLTHWPFDTHTCNLTLSSWVNNGELFVVNFSSVVWDTLSLHMPVLEWKVLDVTYSMNATEEYGFLMEHSRYSFLIQRRSMGYAATIVVPAMVIAGLTLSMFLVDPSGGERILLGGCSMIAHCLYLMYLGWLLHSSAQTCPLIVQFHRDSLLMTTAAMVISVFARRLTGDPQSSSQLSNSPQERICISWLFQVLNVQPKNDACVQLTLKIVDYLSFIGFFLAFAVFLIRLII